MKDVSYIRCGLTGLGSERRAGRVGRAVQVGQGRAPLAADLHPAGRRSRRSPLESPISESPERIAELRRAVKVPEGGDKSYFFLILSSGDMTRYYPFRIATPK